MNKVSSIKVNKVATNLAQGQSYRQSMINAGYSEKTANCGADNKVIQEALNQNSLELAKQGMSPEQLIQEQREFYFYCKAKAKEAKTTKDLKDWIDKAGAWNDRLSKHTLGEVHHNINEDIEKEQVRDSLSKYMS